MLLKFSCIHGLLSYLFFCFYCFFLSLFSSSFVGEATRAGREKGGRKDGARKKGRKGEEDERRKANEKQDATVTLPTVTETIHTIVVQYNGTTTVTLYEP